MSKHYTVTTIDQYVTSVHAPGGYKVEDGLVMFFDSEGKMTAFPVGIVRQIKEH